MDSGTQWVQGFGVQAPELANNVEALLVAVKATNDFEQEMAKRFGGGGSGDSVADEVLLQNIHP